MGPIETALRDIEAEATKYREGKPSQLKYPRGICWNLEERGVYNRWFHDHCHLWPKFSGCHSYPVPGQDKTRVSAANAYHRAQIENRLWVEEYGDLRMELLRWMIEEAKTQGV